METELDLTRFPGFRDFEAHVLQVMAKWNVHGTAMAVVKDGEVVFSRGFGWRDDEQRLAVDSQTLFAIGSASKAFTSTALGILVDRGMLEWDRPVRYYLPFFRLADPFASERITPRDLLSHRSGLPGHNMMWFGSSASRRELVERLAYVQPNRDFRSVFQYQNMMFVAAGYLVEALTGQSWEAFTQEQIFAPLGMHSSNFSVEVCQQSENAARPYRLQGGGLERIPYANIDVVGPAGSINSNLEDMARWVMLQLNKGQYNGSQVVSAESLSQIHKPVIPVPDDFFGPIGQYPDLCFESYGLGWFIQHYRGRRLIHHGGHIDGFGALISFMPEINAGVVFLANDNRTFFVLPLSLNVYDLLLGLDVAPWGSRVLEVLTAMEQQAGSAQEQVSAGQKCGTRPSHDLDAYCARYQHPGYGLLQIVKEGKGLLMTFNGQIVPLAHFHFDVFSCQYEEEGNARQAQVQFHSGVDGEINAVSVPFEPAVEAIRFSRLPG